MASEAFKVINESKGWKEIFSELVVSLGKYAQSTARERMLEKRKLFVKKVIGIFFATVGFIIFIIGVASMISAFIAQGVWTGFVIVGAIVMVVGQALITAKNS